MDRPVLARLLLQQVCGFVRTHPSVQDCRFRTPWSVGVNALTINNLSADRILGQYRLEDCLTVLEFPASHRKRLTSANMVERLMKTIKQRTQVVGVFPNRACCERLVGALLVETHEHWQLAKRSYFNMENFEEEIVAARAAQSQAQPVLRSPSGLPTAGYATTETRTNTVIIHLLPESLLQNCLEPTS